MANRFMLRPAHNGAHSASCCRWWDGRARIQAFCNEYGEELLISEYLHKALPPSPDFNFNLMGTLQLRGRQLPVGVYAVPRFSETANPEHA